MLLFQNWNTIVSKIETLLFQNWNSAPSSCTHIMSARQTAYHIPSSPWSWIHWLFLTSIFGRQSSLCDNCQPRRSDRIAKHIMTHTIITHDPTRCASSMCHFLGLDSIRRCSWLDPMWFIVRDLTVVSTLILCSRRKFGGLCMQEHLTDQFFDSSLLMLR